MKTQKTAKTPSNFKPGTVLRVEYEQGSHAYKGQLAIVVPPEEFPSYHKTMLETIDEKDLYEYFIAVRWVPSGTFPHQPEDGFYTKARFVKASDPPRG